MSSTVADTKDFLTEAAFLEESDKTDKTEIKASAETSIIGNSDYVSYFGDATPRTHIPYSPHVLKENERPQSIPIKDFCNSRNIEAFANLIFVKKTMLKEYQKFSQLLVKGFKDKSIEKFICFKTTSDRIIKVSDETRQKIQLVEHGEEVGTGVLSVAPIKAGSFMLYPGTIGVVSKKDVVSNQFLLAVGPEISGKRLVIDGKSVRNEASMLAHQDDLKTMLEHLVFTPEVISKVAIPTFEIRAAWVADLKILVPVFFADKDIPKGYPLLTTYSKHHTMEIFRNNSRLITKTGALLPKESYQFVNCNLVVRCPLTKKAVHKTYSWHILQQAYMLAKKTTKFKLQLLSGDNSSFFLSKSELSKIVQQKGLASVLIDVKTFTLNDISKAVIAFVQLLKSDKSFLGKLVIHEPEFSIIEDCKNDDPFIILNVDFLENGQELIVPVLNELNIGGSWVEIGGATRLGLSGVNIYEMAKNLKTFDPTIPAGAIETKETKETKEAKAKHDTQKSKESGTDLDLLHLYKAGSSVGAASEIADGLSLNSQQDIGAAAKLQQS